MGDAEADDQKTRVVFYRGRDRWYQQRRYSILVDGAVVGRVRRSEEVSVPLRPGSHIVQARVAATGSRQVTLDARSGSHVRVRVEYAGRFLVGLWRGLTFTRWLRLVVEPTSPRL